MTRGAFSLGAALILLFIIVGVAGGCGAHRRPPSLTKEERELLKAPPLPYAVSIEPWDAEAAARTSRNPEAYARVLADLAIPSGAFRVARRESTPGPDIDLVATSTGVYCNTAVIPLFTILSLGIVPTVWEEEDCEGMILRSAKVRSAPPVQVDVSARGRSVMGWAAVIVGALPGWSWGDVRGDARYRERFRLEVIRHRAAIERLAGRR